MLSNRGYEIDEDETTPDQWQKIAALAAKGDRDKLTNYLSEIGTINLLAGPLFIIAVAEHKRLSAMAEAAKDASPKLAELTGELKFAYLTAANSDPATTRKRIDEIESQLNKLRDQLSHAHVASVHLKGIARRFPKLFGVAMVGDGDKAHYPPVVDSSSPAVHEAMLRVKLPTDVMDPWRFFPPIQFPPKPSKRVASPLTVGSEN